MPRVKILPFVDFLDANRVFDGAAVPEGALAWFQTLASTTLDEGEQSVLVVVADDDGVIRAALPLVRNGSGKLRALTSPYTTLFAPALRDPNWSHFLGSQARSFVPKALRLDGLDVAEPGTAAFIEGLSESGLAIARFAHFKNWFEEISDFNSYWAMRPTRLRSTVRRKLTALQRAHTINFQSAADGSQLEEALSAYLEVYRSSWKPPEPHPQFIETLARRLSNEGTIRLATMKLDSIVVAAQIWLVFRGKATIFKLAHREDAVEF